MVETDRKSEKIADGYDDKDKIKKNGNSLPEKVFVERESLITEMYKDKNIRSIYNFFLAILFGLLISNVLNDYFGINTEKSSIALVIRSFGKPKLVATIWFTTFFTTLIAFRCFNLWAMIRCNIHKRKFATKFIDYFFISLVAFYYLTTYYVLTKIVLHFDLPSASTAFVLLEGTRMLMKVHAFIRNSAPEVLTYKPHSEKQIVQKKITKFIYFMFAPTLIYRDEYPRTKNIRWWYVLKCVAEVFGEILFCSAICQHILIPSFEDFGRRKYTWTEVALKSFSSVPAGMLTSLLLFYCVLHSWQNAFAELLTFADRLFYKDWWTCTSYSRFYRTWNVVVHDWLYTYIYKDVHDWLIPKRKNFAKFLVVLISACVHEYLMTMILRSFCPILFVQFVGLGTFFSSMKFPESSIWNMLFLYSYAFGCGVQLSFYSLEKSARINNPPEINSPFDFFVPRMLTCDCFE